MVSLEDTLVLGISAFVGNVGVALTGFGMAIIYLFAYQILVLCGYDGDFKFVIFVQALALFAAQPLLLKKAQVQKHASWQMLKLFIPITIISTPLGQITGDRVSTDMVKAVGGCLVTFVACFEFFQKRRLIVNYICGKKEVAQVGEGTNQETSEDNKKETDEEDSPADFITVDKTAMSVSDTRSFACDESDSEDFSSVYELGKKLGEGAFSVVHEATLRDTQLRYAVKIVSKKDIKEEEEERLKDEIEILRDVQHDNILTLQEVFEDSRKYYLVTDIMAGGDLLTRLEAVGFFPEFESRRVTKAVLDAISYMHDMKIAHRDIKPENLLLDSEAPKASIKLADFGFAKREETPGCFSTMCGTPAYVAPEILAGVAYGCQADMWSMGVLIYSLLVGYQPFRGDTESQLKLSIAKGTFVFDEQFWGQISPMAKQLISSCLVSNPEKRLTAQKALEDPWFEAKIADVPLQEENKVFFMIGSQRSGSNWLRTMLDEREDLAGPHPPHMMRDFMPIIDKFGDLSDDDNFRVLVDHVCTFVERNQVPWTDKHGSKIKFPRGGVYASANTSCLRVKSARRSSDKEEALPAGMYLLSVFDAIMSFYTRANGKRIWMCKSMGMSKFHDLLLEFYGSKRLRYIYLVRDPRDVAMSFMKTPVGDCHWHAIATKWTGLQHHALRIVENFPELIKKIHYEEILRDKQTVVKGVYDFIGERRFGGVKRQASVLCMDRTEDLIDNAKGGREAQKAQHLSYQFKNLVRGASFAKDQLQKWRHPETGMKPDEIQILETIAHDMMTRLGYECYLVGVVTEPSKWSDEDIANFKKMNEDGIEKMNQDLAKENPADLARRQHQAAALKLAPNRLETRWEEDADDLHTSLHDNLSASLKEHLTEREFDARTRIEPDQKVVLKNGKTIRWAVGSQRGYYPDQHDKPNQDASFVQVGVTKNVHWFGVYDGHGRDGHKCAEFVTDHVPKEFRKSLGQGGSLKSALEKAHIDVHDRLIGTAGIETQQSGTTATTLLMFEDKCIIGNVGDSTAILGWEPRPLEQKARMICDEHTPMRVDERERIKAAGGVVMTADQRDGIEPMHENWEQSAAPPRIWSSQNEKFPGCCFTRSIGDGVAHTLGVTARPEFFEHTITSEDRVLVLCSDGITEWMDVDTIVKIACSHNHPGKAAQALIKEARERWLEKGDYMDDITAIVIFFDYPKKKGSNIAVNGDIEKGLIAVPEDKVDEPPLGINAVFWTLFAGAASGFLGGLCGIRGPPIILYFLHPPYPVSFDKNTQRATGASITAVNVAMRVAYYLVETYGFDGESYFSGDDWPLYIAIVVFSVCGVFVGSMMFEQMKDSRNTIRVILSLFLLLCGVSLLLSSFADL
eukprot:Nitzschia sp. Nitz4//scaffold21_size171442//104174//108556//NITZ4_002174-RA/size171442-augustus-gene-0.186-mRNA-1//1//CDS//3329542450//7927//frame0